MSMRSRQMTVAVSALKGATVKNNNMRWINCNWNIKYSSIKFGLGIGILVNNANRTRLLTSVCRKIVYCECVC